MSFAHLRVHSFCSLREGTASPRTLVEQAHRLGMPALALTDAMNLYGAVEFRAAAASAGIRPPSWGQRS